MEGRVVGGGLIELRVRTLNHLLANARIVSLAHLTTQDTVVFGAKVTLKTKGKEVTYQIVSSEESFILPQTLSINAPLAKLLIGKKIGDTVTVGMEQKVAYTITAIAYV